MRFLKRQPAAMIRVLVAIAMTTVIACSQTTAIAQEESVKPGINKSFADPNVERFIKLFEIESREVYRYREAIVALLGLEEGMHVADVGAGTGLFTRIMAPQVGSSGRVYAVDIAAKFLDHIETKNREAGIENVELVQCDQHSTNLAPASVDRLFVCDTYHHFEFPNDTLTSMLRALRPDGRLMIVDFERIQGVSNLFVLGHVRCGKGTVTDEVLNAGFTLEAEIPMMDEQYVLVFKKRAAKSNSPGKDGQDSDRENEASTPAAGTN